MEGYDPSVYIKNSSVLSEIIHLIQSGFFSPGQYNLFEAIVDNLTRQDPYFICADFNDYCSVQEQISREYNDSKSWIKKSIINVASSGKFSSDRTIKNYAKDVWTVPLK
jgi:starch phosphorylase